jgi:aerobic-type carbon monoxide dehydrogenase small subunit (CoxS/CutS family)
MHCVTGAVLLHYAARRGANAAVTTIEGSTRMVSIHRKRLIETQVPQCGYCRPEIMQAQHSQGFS